MVTGAMTFGATAALTTTQYTDLIYAIISLYLSKGALTSIVGLNTVLGYRPDQIDASTYAWYTPCKLSSCFPVSRVSVSSPSSLSFSSGLLM